MSILVFSGNHMKKGVSSCYDSFVMEGSVDKELDLASPGLLSTGSVRIALKYHRINLLRKWILIGHCGVDDFLINDLLFHLGADVKGICHDVINDAGISLYIAMDSR